MTDSERADLKAAFEHAKARLPKGHKIVHVRWHDGQLQFTAERIDGKTAETPRGWLTEEQLPRPTKRGIVQAELEL